MISDQSQRDQALDVRRSFIVQAPAGSGKTELLVQRFLKLISIVKEPEEILAITFTRKAAAEMRSRVLAALKNPALAHRLRIQTIDAFCTALTRQMPVLARVGAQPEIVEDAKPLYKEAAARVFEEFNPATERLLAHLDNNIPLATEQLAKMLESRDRWLRKTGAVPTRAELEATLVSERTRLLKHAQALYPKASEALARGVLTQKGEWTKRSPPPPELVRIPGMREALFALCNMPPAQYDDRQWEALEAILAMLKPAVAQLKVLFGERGQADFTEFAHGALEALGSVDDPSDLLLSLDQKISHVLVDEFQDTSLSQYELLTKLTSGWQEGDGRTLFLVGDPMQSIYTLSLHVALPAGQALRARVGEARADRAQHQPPLAGRPREVVQRVVPARAPRAGRPDIGRRAVPSRFTARERACRRRSELALRLRPRGGSEEGRCYRPGGFGQQGDPGPQPRAPRRDRAGAQGGGRALPRPRHRAARREAGRAGPLRADARAPAPRRPHRLARVPARALVRPHPRRSPRPLVRPERGRRQRVHQQRRAHLRQDARRHPPLARWPEARRPRPLGPRAAGEEPAARLPARARRGRVARARRPRVRRERDRPRGRRDLPRRARAPGRGGRGRSRRARGQDRPPPLRPARRKGAEGRGRDHDHPSRQGPRVRHGDCPRPRPPASLRTQAAPRLEVAPSLRTAPRADR